MLRVLAAACLAVSVADAAETPAHFREKQGAQDGTCHNHSEYRRIYEGLLGLGKRGGGQDLLVDHVVEVSRASGLDVQRVLDIGPGPGHISLGLSEAFPAAQLTLVEPNPAFRESCAARLEGTTFKMHPTTLDEYDCQDTKHDLVVLSHVLYHVDDARWGAFLDRAFDCVAEGGRLMVAMMHDAGLYFDFITNDYFGKVFTSSREVKAHFEARGGDYSTKVQAIPMKYSSGSIATDFEALYDAMYFLVVEDGLEPEQYRTMNVEQASVLSKQIRDFVWSLFNAETREFIFPCTQEYVSVRKAAARSEL